MANPDIAQLAFTRAWSVYRLINSGVDENDQRRATLQRFIRERRERGETSTEALVVAGLKYLKEIDEFGDSSFS